MYKYITNIDFFVGLRSETCFQFIATCLSSIVYCSIIIKLKNTVDKLEQQVINYYINIHILNGIFELSGSNCTFSC